MLHYFVYSGSGRQRNETVSSGLFDFEDIYHEYKHDQEEAFKNRMKAISKVRNDIITKHFPRNML